jgi:hypothetical protein
VLPLSLERKGLWSGSPKAAAQDPSVASVFGCALTLGAVSTFCAGGLAACHARGGESTSPQSSAAKGSAVGAPSAARDASRDGSASTEQGPRTLRLVPEGGIGFDDLLFVPTLHGVIAPAGRTGCVNVFDSTSLAGSLYCGISQASSKYTGGHGDGTTSADAGAGLLFAADRRSVTLKVIDLESKHVAASLPLKGNPDYVRWLEAKREVWVTEPDREQIEIFSLGSGAATEVRQSGTIAVKGGPESLAVDGLRGTAYTHLWEGSTVAIDLASRAVSPAFRNGCQGSRGIAVDPKKQLLFVGCSEGKAVVLDLAQAGQVVSSEHTPSGVDIIAVNLELNHLYVPAASDGSVNVFGFGAPGKLRQLGSFAAPRGAHCVASDDHAHAWVCAPEDGSLVVLDDRFPRSE